MRMKKYIIAIIPWIILYFGFYYSHQWEINLALRDLWRISFLYVTLSLLVSPIISMFDFQKLLPWRRVFWVISFFLALAHTWVYFYFEKIYSNSFFVLANIKEPDVFSWIIWLILIFILWVTSNNFSVKILRWTWNKIQSLVYPLFLILALHVAFSSRFEGFYMVLIGSLVIFRSVAFLNRNTMHAASWKPLYVCIPCGYIYDEEKWDSDSWILPWTKFEDIPDSWKCPVCWVWKEDFELIWWENTKKELIKSTIASKEFLTKDVIELKIYSATSFYVMPGQFAKFAWKDETGEFERSYSIVSYNDWILTFCIKLNKDWKWSQKLKEANIWDMIFIEWIFWHFALKETKKPKVFLATWTWLSPIFSIISKNKLSENFLFFWVKNMDDVFYEEEIKKLPNLNYNIYCSWLSENCWTYRKWRIDINEFDFSQDTEFYICWNPEMVKECIGKLSEKWYKNIYFEQF